LEELILYHPQQWLRHQRAQLWPDSDLSRHPKKVVIVRESYGILYTQNGGKIQVRVRAPVARETALIQVYSGSQTIYYTWGINDETGDQSLLELEDSQ